MPNQSENLKQIYREIELSNTVVQAAWYAALWELDWRCEAELSGGDFFYAGQEL